jgi:hypothetical protein
MTLIEQIDKRLVQIYFEQGLRIVLNRWMPWAGDRNGPYEIMFKPNRGLSLRTVPERYDEEMQEIIEEQEAANAQQEATRGPSGP